jgi:hypothetical protein
MNWQPDVVFTIFPSTLALYKGQAPAIFVTDLTFQAWQEHGAGFGQLALNGLVSVEHQAVQRSARVIVHSQWGKNEIVRRHGVKPDKIEILTMPAAIRSARAPSSIAVATRRWC